VPLHDWSLAPDNVFHNFHLTWLAHLAASLNRDVLPEGYLARTEEWLGPFQADVLALEVEGRPSPDAGRPRETRQPSPQPTATIAPPHFERRRERSVAVFSARDERRVAVIEVVSRGNKDSDRRARSFEEKLIECLSSGLHLLLVDLHPPTRPAPGFAAGVARELRTGDVPEVPSEGRCVTSFEVRPDPEVRVYHQSLALGAPLPEAPLFLEPGASVTVELESAYEAAFAWLPGPDRALLGGEPREQG